MQLRQSLEAEHGLFLAEGEKVVRRAVAGRLPGPVLPDGAPLARRAGRRHGARPTRRATSSPRPSPSRSPASTSTAVPWPRWPGPRCPRVDEVLDGRPHASWCARTSSTTPTSGAIFRSAAALGVDGVLLAPRCADPLYRRSVKVAMGAVFALPWTRLPDWYDALPASRAPRLHHGRPDPGRGRRAARRTRWPDWTRLPSSSGSEGHGLSAHWERTAQRSAVIPMRAGHRLPERRGGHRGRVLRNCSAMN